MTDMTVANEIHRQLGGGMFSMITGAHSFVGGDNKLTFQLKPGAKNKIKYISITLGGDDTYIMHAYRLKELEPVTIEKHENVYCDNLLDVFESMTGLYATLHKRS